jgi:putative ABC transport system ATP-binding protein
MFGRARERRDAGAPPPSALAIELDGVEQHSGAGACGLRVLNQVSLRITAGEIVAIQGPTGAGKTTLLHVIAGQCRPSAGAVVILGHHIEHASDELIRQLLHATVRSVLEDTELVDKLTLLDNMALALLTRAPSTPRERRRRALEALSAVGMERRGHAVVATLSSGERQRVAVAHALVSGPRIVVVDEPGRNLDRRGAEHVVGLLVRARGHHRRARDP